MASRDSRGPGHQRLLENGVCGVGADVEDGPQGFALDLRLAVIEQQREIGQRILAAELPQQIDRRPAHGGVGRALQPLHGLPARRAEGDEERRQPLARAAALFGRQRFGERPHQHLADRQAQRLDALELRLVDRRQVRDDVAHHRAGDEQVDGDHRVAGDCASEVSPGPFRSPERWPAAARRRSRRRAAGLRLARRPASSDRPSAPRPARCAADRGAA